MQKVNNQAEGVYKRRINKIIGGQEVLIMHRTVVQLDLFFQ